MDEPWVTLVVTRGWSTEIDPRHPVFLERLRAEGVEVIDVFVPAETSRSFDEWVDRYVDAIEVAVPDRSRPLHCLGYCVGGNLLGQAAQQLADRGRTPAYVGLVDTRVETTLQRLAHNIHHRVAVPFSVRIRLLMMSVGTPLQEPLRKIALAWLGAVARSIGSAITKGPRSVRRRNDPAWHTMHISYSAPFTASVVPHHRYVARESVEKYGDPSLNSAPWSRGGFAVRIVGGDHLTCLTDPHLDGLVRAIVDDLREPLPLLLEIDRGQSRQRSDR